MKRILGVVLGYSVLASACGTEATDATGGPEDGGLSEDGPCSKGKIEEDLVLVRMKPIADLGALAPASLDPGTVVSTTYLRLRQGDAGAARFGELMVPIQGVLSTQPGLLGLELAISASCGTARTLSVWESIDAMYAFSTGEAHLQAVRSVSDVSRGGSLVGHWEGATLEDATWDEAARQLALRDGPYY